MKTTIALLGFLLIAPAVAAAQAQAPAAQGGARLQLDSLDALAKQAREVVNVNIDPEGLMLLGGFARGAGDPAALKAALSELRGVYVRQFEFDKPIDTALALAPIRKQLTQGGWTPLINVDSSDDGQVHIYMWRDGDRPGGFAILAAESDELTVVNIVGPIDIAKLAALGGQFGIPQGIPGVR
jgi:hypothetical protein